MLAWAAPFLLAWPELPPCEQAARVPAVSVAKTASPTLRIKPIVYRSSKTAGAVLTSPPPDGRSTACKPRLQDVDQPPATSNRVARGTQLGWEHGESTLAAHANVDSCPASALIAVEVRYGAAVRLQYA